MLSDNRLHLTMHRTIALTGDQTTGLMANGQTN